MGLACLRPNSFRQLQKGTPGNMLVYFISARLTLSSNPGSAVVQAGGHYRPPDRTTNAWPEASFLLTSAVDPDSPSRGLEAQQSPGNVASESRAVVPKPCAPSLPGSTGSPHQLPSGPTWGHGPSEPTSLVAPVVSPQPGHHRHCPHSTGRTTLMVCTVTSPGWPDPGLSLTSLQSHCGPQCSLAILHVKPRASYRRRRCSPLSCSPAYPWP